MKFATLAAFLASANAQDAAATTAAAAMAATTAAAMPATTAAAMPAMPEENGMEGMGMDMFMDDDAMKKMEKMFGEMDVKTSDDGITVHMGEGNHLKMTEDKNTGRKSSVLTMGNNSIEAFENADGTGEIRIVMGATKLISSMAAAAVAY